MELAAAVAGHDAEQTVSIEPGAQFALSVFSTSLSAGDS
jgi:hypothetical protein